MHRWSQNISEGRFGFHRRGHWWLYDLENPKATRRSIGWELDIPSHHYGLSIELGYDDEPFLFFIGLGLGIWVHLESPLLVKLRDRLCPKRKDGKPKYEGREWSITFHDGSAYWNIGRSADGWSSSDGWRHSSFNLPDFLLGRQVYSEDDIQSWVEAAIPMPEKTYAGKVRVYRSIWTRPRWPFRKTMVRAEVSVEHPPMFAGKGENSWDCDDDCIFAMTTRAGTVTDAVAKYQEAVYRHRSKYGQPSKAVHS